MTWLPSWSAANAVICFVCLVCLCWARPREPARPGFILVQGGADADVTALVIGSMEAAIVSLLITHDRMGRDGLVDTVV